MNCVVKKTNLRDDFLAWQCRIRQIAMRQDGGRPSPGMRPRVLDASGREVAARLTVLLVPKDPEEATSFFRFQAGKSHDAREIYERALAYFQADYFQTPATFSDQLLAVLPAAPSPRPRWSPEQDACSSSSNSARPTVCRAAFPRSNQGTRPAMPRFGITACSIPLCPTTVHVVAFQPDWASARANPGPNGRKTPSF